MLLADLSYENLAKSRWERPLTLFFFRPGKKLSQPASEGMAIGKMA